jgi:hypothetical protein
MDVIYEYTRAQALSDGVLVDVSEMAKEAGICHPTAVTAAVWNNHIRVPDGVSGQDVIGRLWDVLWMFTMEVHRLPKTMVTNLVFYQVLVRNDESEPKPVQLKAFCGPGDDERPVITIMLLDEW